ncbi:single-stranded-DNA-specific exonuclease RecJ [Treponema pallidum]|uniref:Single-stranded-DNA-specific exonuclease RecJ n=6 Tax=Treponema pallidum TaxID=160 RepID=O83702_TREPA|nr:single-stranded-DNA-specific exonuclease RecJ [Treponema pallidum]AAC65672.1 single-stranded-DNA-specific exonuclease (recJ) [Treponema pallidum subsp. pallidum str. Nichols]ACD71122.1 single-stranded-DNA-specific exonuclease [Treponema pallidum subsp. pallidum SS14]ADD72803.1 single-stranded-DNA-specific exonuclease RecJ [Treponema pallidum subsp. pallidum str. Chicago]AEZ57828.1 single-stranded-DNA-specific exonuclease [Treponema pallidum subsp. pertenue str. SamoaD]AEZ58897.1 single-stra
MKRWRAKALDEGRVRELTARYSCSALEAAILVRRKVVDADALLFHFERDLRYLPGPFRFHAMSAAVDRLRLAHERKEKVLIFGDRDADGISATTLLFEALCAFGLTVCWRVPVADEPYGLSCNAVDEHAAAGGTLIVTVDCGISNRAEIAYARHRGIDVLVIDHHAAPETLPDAIIINAKVPGAGYPHEFLSGCATAWKVVTALRFSTSGWYQRPVVLLHVRPVTGAYTIEAVKMCNMEVVDRLSETVVPRMLLPSHTRLGAFLEGQEVFVWDEQVVRTQLAKVFGGEFPWRFTDVRPRMAAFFPQCERASLLRMKDFSRIGRARSKPMEEIESFINLFITFVQKDTQLYRGAADELQLVAISTLSDLMVLAGENRIMVRYGLQAMNEAPRVGLRELFAIQRLMGKKLGTVEVGWSIVPLINATGRLGCPHRAVELFLMREASQRALQARKMVQLNEQRKKLGRSARALVEPLARASLETYSNRLAVVCSDKIHRGVTGILANCLSEALRVPCVIICIMADGHAVGSLRSARGYHLFSLLDPLADLFSDYGGHAFAAGFSIPSERIPQLLHRMELYAATIEFADESAQECGEFDAELDATQMTRGLLTLVDRFEPYGEGNPPLCFLAKRLKIFSASLFGRTERVHVKLTLDAQVHKWPAIYWGAGEKLAQEFAVGDVVDAVFQVTRNTFQGTCTPQLVIQDLWRSE